jgi:hypothetical protein
MTPSITKKFKVVAPFAKRLKCVMCDFADVCRDKFKQHVFNDHEKPVMNRKRMSCTFCNFRTSLTRDMKAHAKTCHPSSAAEAKTFFDGESPTRKKRRVSPEEEVMIEFRCKCCGFVSTNKTMVVDHFMELHVDRKVVDVKKSASGENDNNGVPVRTLKKSPTAKKRDISHYPSRNQVSMI